MDATVLWDANNDDTTGYEVHHGYSAGDYFESFTVVHPTAQKAFTGLDDFKEHHFAVKAFDAALNITNFSANVSKRVAHRFTMK